MSNTEQPLKAIVEHDASLDCSGHRKTAVSSRDRPDRIGELDALRGLAAIGVMLFHYTTQYQVSVGHVSPPDFDFPAGNYGVHLFFLISGFVIFMTLGRTRKPMDFVVSRFSRLYPAYWAAIIVSAIFVYTIGLPEQRLPAGELLANFTMIQQFFNYRHLDGSYWTLQIELFFYVQMFVWFLLGFLRGIRWIIMSWLLLSLAYALATITHHHLSSTVEELLIVQQIPFFALGILFHQLHTHAAGERITHLMIAACIAVIGATHELPYLLAALAWTGGFYAFVYGWLRWLAAAPFAFLGTISYSLYLLHQVIGFDVIWQLERRAHLDTGVAVSLAILISILLATGLTFLVEKPAMRWIRSHWKARKAAEALPVAL